ncbi:hypothetical protein CH266_00690 [Rhodococcus sp. 06-1474-1B]|uniref:hypothetical protein n=1 Tax=unclassified Rhodococcus (in: high G+C Gram-positive bacteria) TaxID=192944 RepID=UPI000B9B23F8|nr:MULTISPECIES: hypothetical protein [unclassified Rhodococcus (in: high G+C Gram-positive bacteria)]OZD55875.1 hypothetical protein CH266_00690 [Rhodococcus sp. 06-1474-1B]OZF42405.1 hypothetical protein CH291_25715 [Rhodococcus sp. 14-1411-2a]
MDIATAADGHQKALDLVMDEPTLDNLEQYDAAATIYTGFLNHRISLYFRIGMAGFVALGALYFLLNAPPVPATIAIWVWVIAAMVPITWNMRWLLMVRKLVVSAHVFVDTASSLRNEG